MKTGRNDQCPCGSGKKYKKCCLDSKNIKIPTEVMEHFKKVDIERKKLNSMGIYANYVSPIMFQEKKVWALGSRVYHSRRPEETFHEFILDVFKQTLGREWWEEQLATQEKHFIMQCFLHYFEWQKRNAVADNCVDDKIWGSIPDGWTQTLIATAFDVCSLIHTKRLPDHLLNRLKNKKEYQGARYEIAIAAIFARLDCDIEFLDDLQQTKKHCEFFATHRKSQTVVAVEAKSRHREGVIHTEGILNLEKIVRGDVRRLLNGALKQNPGDKPFMIFIDVNSPSNPDVNFQDKQWGKDVKEIIDTFSAPTPDNPDSHNGIFFTNFSYHYQGEKQIVPYEHLSVIPMFSKHSLPDDNFMDMILCALNHYGSVPNITRVE